MIGSNPFRNFQSVMIVTLHVAVIAFAIRSFAGPSGWEGSVAIWAPLSILLALFLSLPLGHAVAAAFHPSYGLSERRCPRCERGQLRPLLRAGGGIFQPIVGYRCAACRTTYRPMGDTIVEESAVVATGPVDPEGVHFLPDRPVEFPESDGIRFLDANKPAEPVSND